MGLSGSNKDRTRPPAAAARGTAGASHRWTIPSDFAATREVQQQVGDDLDRHRYSPHSTFAIKLALEEALINAIKHGNRLDPAKRVHVEARVTPTRCDISVEDEGPGFKRRAVPDPTLEENLEKCSGRGILLMEAYMSKVAWDRGGRRVKLTKFNKDDVPPP